MTEIIKEEIIEVILPIKQESPNRIKRESPRKRIKTEDSPRKRRVNQDDIEDFVPPNWRAQYALLEEQRETGPVAPVDTMGCNSHTHIDLQTARFHALVSLMLSAQCKDTINALTMTTLKQVLPRGLTVHDILEIEESALRDLIRPCGLHNRKAKYIKSAATMLHEQFNDDVPQSITEILLLPGVGPKMGYLLLSTAWGVVDGIGVDTHVHRISNLLQWVATSTPEQTRVALQGWLDRDKWIAVNHLMVGLGQTVCLPRGRKCSQCKISPLCPSVVADSPRKVKVKSED